MMKLCSKHWMMVQYRNGRSILYVFLGTVAQAALDVFESEPPPPDHPLVKHPQVTCLFSKHISVRGIF